MKRYWTVFWRLRAMRLQAILEYRSDFLFWSGMSLIWTVFNYFFVALLGSVTGDIAGWNVAELLVLLSIYSIFDSLTWSFFYPNMRDYTAAIFSGKLDYTLVRPMDTQFLIMVANNNFGHISRFIVGIGGLVWSLQHLPYAISGWNLMYMLVGLICSSVLLYSLWFMIASVAFWVEKLDSINDIVPSLRRLFQVPRQVFTGVSSVLLSVIVPLALVTTIPAELVLGRAEPGWVVYFVLFTLAAAIGARWFFNLSLKKYSGVGS